MFKPLHPRTFPLHLTYTPSHALALHCSPLHRFNHPNELSRRPTHTCQLPTSLSYTPTPRRRFSSYTLWFLLILLFVQAQHKTPLIFSFVGQVLSGLVLPSFLHFPSPSTLASLLSTCTDGPAPWHVRFCMEFFAPLSHCPSLLPAWGKKAALCHLAALFPRRPDSENLDTAANTIYWLFRPRCNIFVFFLTESQLCIYAGDGTRLILLTSRDIFHRFFPVNFHISDENDW